MHASFHLIPLHFSHLVDYRCISSFFLNFEPVFENRESSSSWVNVYYFSRHDSHTLSPECGITIYLFIYLFIHLFCQCVVCLSFISSLSLLFHRLETLTRDHYFTLPQSTETHLCWPRVNVTSSPISINGAHCFTALKSLDFRIHFMAWWRDVLALCPAAKCS